MALPLVPRRVPVLHMTLAVAAAAAAAGAGKQGLNTPDPFQLNAAAGLLEFDRCRYH